MFQLLPCSNCQRTFSLREEVSQDAWLKCPNCGNQFRLGDMLDAFYSPWHIVPAPGAAHLTDSMTAAGQHHALADDQAYDSAALHAAQRAAGDNQPADSASPDLTTDAASDLTIELSDSELQLAADDAYSYEYDPNSVQEDDNSRPLDSESTQSLDHQSPDHGPRTAAVKSRSRASKGPSIWTFVQVMLGGAASIPVTLLLLWYVAGKDVMNAGPRIAQYVPWIVPEKFHYTSLPEPAMRGSRPPVNPPAPGASGFRNFDDVLPMDGDRLAKPSASANEPAEATAGSQAPVAEPVETDTTMTELFATVASVKKKIAEYDTNESNAGLIVSRLTALMDDLAKISEQLGKVPAGGGAVKLLRNDLKDIGRALSSDPKLEAAFKSGIRAQFNGAMKRPGTGRVYLGTVSELVDQGDAWQIKHAENQSGKIPGYNLEANIPKAVAEQLQQDTKVFLLGELVSDETESDAAAPEVVRVRANFLQSL